MLIGRVFMLVYGFFAVRMMQGNFVLEGMKSVRQTTISCCGPLRLELFLIALDKYFLLRLDWSFLIQTTDYSQLIGIAVSQNITGNFPDITGNVYCPV